MTPEELLLVPAGSVVVSSGAGARCGSEALCGCRYSVYLLY